MATVNVLIVVDVLNAVSPGHTGGLSKNLYMMDTNHFLGTLEAGNELITTLNAGDVVAWACAPIDPGTNIAITGFTGQAKGVNINPKQDPVTGAWESKFTVPIGTPANSQFQYSVSMSINGQPYSFDPFLLLQTATAATATAKTYAT
jgi:hypothetical protein